MKMAELTAIFFCLKVPKKRKKSLYIKYFVYICNPTIIAPLQPNC